MCDPLKKLMTVTETAGVKPRHISRLLGVRHIDFENWVAHGSPTEYHEDIDALASQLETMVASGVLPKAQNELAVMGLLFLSKQ